MIDLALIALAFVLGFALGDLYRRRKTVRVWKLFMKDELA